jgi:predicted RNA-binding protein with PUA-like domain
MSKKFWLFKSDPSEFSWEDLKKSKNQTTFWDGIRNYQARNFLRDEVKKGDGVLFYQSSTEPLAILGYCEVVKEGYPDHTQFDEESDHYFPSATQKEPVWFMVDIKLKHEFKKPVTLESIKANPKLKNMKLIQRGQRLSILSVTKSEWDEVMKMGS